MNDYLQQSFTVTFNYRVHFTNNLFDVSNSLFDSFLQQHKTEGVLQKILFVVDSGVIENHPQLEAQIRHYFKVLPTVQLVAKILVIPGGETAKNNTGFYNEIVDAVNDFGVDRHSYLAAIGGGSVLDLAGYAAAVSHRGIKHIRIPTTVLSQNDSGVGVKNGVNFKNKKNFIGTFSPPVAVFNDEQFLTTLSDRDWRSGISEAIKVALIKDAVFFSWLKENATLLAARNMAAMRYLIKRCAALHLEHIRSGDPFESGSSRPLDFGHWSAHKVEQLSNFKILHGEAVSMGIALDIVYSGLLGKISENDVQIIINVLQIIGLPITHSLMEIRDENSPVLKGLNEFREHLGGRLTITLLTAIGRGEEVHEIDWQVLKKAADKIKNMSIASPKMATA